MSAVRITGGARFGRGVLAVVAGLVSVAALAGGGPARAGVATRTQVAAARAAASGGTWGTAEEVPGVAALAEDGSSYAVSVSCGAVGNCSAGGYYTTFVNEPGPVEAFVVSETNGTWGAAVEVPGTAALNQGGYAQLASVSCASAGNCSAGGYYTRGSGGEEAFVVSETNGIWGAAAAVPGTDQIESVSCPSAGNCSAGGYYTDGSGREQVFVVSETNGTWGTAAEVPGFSGLNQGGSAQLAAVSCASAGNCSAGGEYLDSSGREQVFIVDEANGTWGTVREVPGTAALNKGGSARIYSASCGAAGDCSAGGSYRDRSGQDQAFVATEKGGTWGLAKEVPGTAALNKGGSARIESVSCASAGDCSAGGGYLDSSRNGQAFVVGEKGGTWGTAKEVPGSAALNKSGSAQTESVSCASAGNCSAGGGYAGSYNGSSGEVFVVGETNGTWGTAKEMPGFSALNQGGGANIGQVSCASVAHCSAVGYYTTRARNGFNEGFVGGET